jgi:1-acyl-sn-glycerol-3-phosphate acyltransferase
VDAVGRAWDAALAAVARLMMRVFYRSVEVRGALPRASPLVVIANHGNSFVDSLLVFGFLGRPARFLGKHTLWRHPLVGPLVTLARVLPVHRRGDAGARPARNERTFARCARLLARGGAVALFPEGRSHDEPRCLPLKSGAARIVTRAQAEGARGLLVAPVGIVYEDKGRFRSRVVLRVGAALAPASGAGVPEPVAALTARFARALAEAANPAPAGEPWPAPPPRARGRSLRLALAAPFNWLPYRVPGWIASRRARRGDEPATYKVLAGHLAFPGWWSLVALGAAALLGPAATIAFAVLAPLTGWLALGALDARAPSGAAVRARAGDRAGGGRGRA